MSLSTFLELKEVRDRFRREFLKPEGGVRIRGHAKLRCHAKLALGAPPLTKTFAIAGTAFDYLLRFYVKKLNPFAVEREWVAENALEVLGRLGDERMQNRAKQALRNSKAAYRRYLSGKKRQKPGAELIRASIRLAYLDTIFRAGIVDDAAFAEAEKSLIEELSNLLGLVRARDLSARRVCVLNPTFGKGSQLGGGADADLLIDHTLIEIKTTKERKLRREIFNQLIGYYLLSRIGGIDGCAKRHPIRTLAVYYSRDGVFRSVSVRTVIPHKNVGRIISWFARKAKEQFPFQNEAA